MELVEGVAAVDDVDGFVDDLRAIGDEHGVTCQTFDARLVVDREHLRRAVELADRAVARDDAIARSRGVEILLYAAGRRQIRRALAMGVDEGETPVVVLVDAPPDDSSFGGIDPDGDTLDGTDSAERSVDAERAAAAAVADLLAPAETLGDYDPERVREFFDVGETELEAADGDLPALVRERVALLVVEK